MNKEKNVKKAFLWNMIGSTCYAKLLVSGAKKRGAVLSNDTAKYLISISGNDMKILLNELDKLSYYAKGGEITKEIIDNMELYTK